jgi:hypothetical protein
MRLGTILNECREQKDQQAKRELRHAESIHFPRSSSPATNRLTSAENDCVR